MKRYLIDCLISGLAGGLVSHAVVAARSRAETGKSDRAMHAVSHIAWGDAPESHRGETARNWLVGAALHHGACVFWATFFEGLFGRRAERNTTAALIGGATISATAYVTDYHVVPSRYSPGFEAHLSTRSLFLVYAGLAVGLAAGARLRGLYRHQVEDRDERDKGRNAERRPDAMVAPE